MGLSKRTIEMLLDLVEIKLSYMDISDREDQRDLQVLERCREVTVTFETEIANREITKLAAGCVAAEAQGAMLRFVDVGANVHDHEGAIRELMPDAVQVQSEGMNLKAIGRIAT